MEKKTSMTYEKAMKKLEEIVNKIESENMDIDQLAAKIREAKQLSDFCKDKLTKVEADIKESLSM